MFSKIAFFSVVSMAVFVAASPSLGGLPVPADDSAMKHGSDLFVTRGDDQCNTGPVQCCDAVYKSNSKEANFFETFTGTIQGSPDTLMASSCSPINTAAGSAENACTAQTVCCTDNKYKGFVAFGCSPFNLNINTPAE